MKTVMVILLMALISCGHEKGGYLAATPEGQEEKKHSRWSKVATVGAGVGLVVVTIVGARALIKHLERCREIDQELLRNAEKAQKKARLQEKAEELLKERMDAEEFRKKAKFWGDDVITFKNWRRWKSYGKFWPHEAIGTIEVREFLQGLRNQGYPFHVSDVAVVDNGFPYNAADTRLSQAAEDFLNLKEGYQLKKPDKTPETHVDKNKNHGMQVASIIAGKHPIGTSVNARLSYIQHLDRLEEMEIPSSDIVNFSWAKLKLVDGQRTLLDAFNVEVLPDDMSVPKAELNDLLGGKSIIVQGSGNVFPDLDNYLGMKYGIIPDPVENFGDRVIKVGSVSRNGFVSSFSQTGKDVVVLAPSDKSIMSSSDGVTHTTFSGTSGAAPLVTAALADVASILPELNRSEARELLQRTAIKTSTNEVSEMNGAGVLNHYKLVRVAKRLADLGHPQNREALLNNELYDFSAEAKELFASVTVKDDLTTYIKKLRTAFFLDADNAEIRTKLADVYRQAGMQDQAQFFDIPAKSLQHAAVQANLKERVKWGTNSGLLIFMMVETINNWLYINGKIVKSGIKKIDNTKLKDIPDLKVDRDNLQDAIRLAEDIELREPAVLTHLIKYAKETGKDDILHTLEAYARNHYPSLNF